MWKVVYVLLLFEFSMLLFLSMVSGDVFLVISSCLVYVVVMVEFVFR